MAGAGLDAEIVNDINPRVKDALGKMAYWMAGFRKLGSRLPEFTVEAEGREFGRALHWPAGFAITAAIWRLRLRSRCSTTSSSWFCLKARARSGF